MSKSKHDHYADALKYSLDPNIFRDKDEVAKMMKQARDTLDVAPVPLSRTATELRDLQQMAAAKMNAMANKMRREFDDKVAEALINDTLAEGRLTVSRPQRSRPWNKYDKLRMRLSLEEGGQFDMHINIMEGASKTFVFLAKNDKAIVLEDDTTMYPSDALIMAYRLFEQSVKD